MRRMELAGDLIAGRYFSGINSLQFAPPGIARELEAAEADNGIYWMNAADPASPSGIPALTSLFENSTIKLPSRLPSSRIAFRGCQVIAVTSRGGKDLALAPELCEELPTELLDFIKFPKTRNIAPETKIVIEKINGTSAASSPVAARLKENGFVSDRGKLVLW
jgi:ATP-dependent Lhr-like helicase